VKIILKSSKGDFVISSGWLCASGGGGDAPVICWANLSVFFHIGFGSAISLLLPVSLIFFFGGSFCFFGALCFCDEVAHSLSSVPLNSSGSPATSPGSAVSTSSLTLSVSLWALSCGGRLQIRRSVSGHSLNHFPQSVVYFYWHTTHDNDNDDVYFTLMTSDSWIGKYKAVGGTWQIY